MFEGLTFTSPLLWWGALAAGLPFLIHWMLRPRPQKVLFPATFLLQRALAEGQKAQRLRNLWLLLVRALGLIVVAGLLAGPTCRSTADVGTDQRPLAAVLVCDDAWSSAYRATEDQAVLDQLRTAALGVVAEARDWPPGSTLGLIAAGGALEAIPPTAQFERVEDQLQQLRDVRPHARTLRDAVRQAGEWLRSAGQSRRRLILLTDMAGHAVRDVSGDLLDGIRDLEVTVLAGPGVTRTNLAILSAEVPAGLLAETASVPLRVRLRAEGAAARGVLVVRSGDRVLLRSTPLDLPAGQVVEERYTLPRFPRGVHGLQVTLEPTDRLPFDQERYVAFEVGPPPEVWLLEPGVAQARSLTGHLLENLLAPPTLLPEQQLVALRRIPAEDVPEAAAPPALILVPSGVPLSDSARGRLRDLVERGARMVLIAAAGTRIEWPGLRRYFAARVAREELAEPSRLNWDADSGVSGEVRAALDRCVVDVRVGLFELAEGVRVEARYADGAPGVLRRTFGRGSLHLLTTSPDPAWSTLGARALGLLGWLLELAQAGGTDGLQVAQVPVGTLVKPGLARLPEQGTVRVTPPDGGPPVSLRMNNTAAWPTDAPGLLRLQVADGSQRLIALNWPAEESDLAEIDGPGLARVLGVSEVLLRGRDTEGGGSGWSSALARPGGWLAAGLLLLLALELVLSEWRAASSGEKAGAVAGR